MSSLAPEGLQLETEGPPGVVAGDNDRRRHLGPGHVSTLSSQQHAGTHYRRQGVAAARREPDISAHIGAGAQWQRDRSEPGTADRPQTGLTGRAVVAPGKASAARSVHELPQGLEAVLPEY